MSDITITGGPTLTMTSLEIAEVVNSRHDDVRRSIRRLAERGVIQLPPMAEVKNHLGQAVQIYRVGKRDSYVIVAQLSPEFTARLVDRWQELESAARFASLPDFTNPIAAARAWADQVEARMHAERTKAEIGSRREATAMNKVSQEAKRAKKLAQVLDKAKQYASVKRMSGHYGDREFAWRDLKGAATDMGIPSIDVFDANYGTVKAYHADVWRKVYGLEIPDGIKVGEEA